MKQVWKMATKTLVVNCDNTAVMKGEDKGLRTLLKNFNKLAEYVPCLLISLILSEKKLL